MDLSANAFSLPPVSGGARGFVAARRRRRQQLEAAPALRWDRVVAVTSPSDALPEGTPVWSLRLSNDGGHAASARVALFTSNAIIRGEIGEAGQIGGGDHWELTLDLAADAAAGMLRGYALVQGADGRWHGTTIDGRTASFRTQPDELGILRTLGLKLPVSATEQDGLIRSDRASAETTPETSI